MPHQLSKHACVTYFDDVQLSDGLQSRTLYNPVVVACSDMGLQLPYVCTSLATQVFVCQNFGNSLSDSSVLAAIGHSSADHVIVYGHTNCWFLQQLVAASDEEEWFQKHFKHMRLQCKRILASNLSRDESSVWREISQYYILNELKMLLNRPEFAQLSDGKVIELHAWLYDSEDNDLEVFDPRSQQFISMRR